jgi:hypothetical protein
MVAPKPKISLPEKFDGTRLKFRGFVSQVRVIMQLHPRRYFDDTWRTPNSLKGSNVSPSRKQRNKEELEDFP